MEHTYDEMLKRLVQEREKNHLSQTEISALIGMSQGHYSKAELGIKRFTYHQLEKLNQTNLDLHYIFTDNSSDHMKILESQHFATKIQASDYYCLAQLFYALLQRLSTSQSDSHYTKLLQKYQVFRSTLTTDPQNVWKVIRRCYDYTQLQMSEKLGVDVKKYTKLENGKIKPDSELIFRAYHYFGVPPQIILGDNRGILRMICDGLIALDENDRTRILKVFVYEEELLG